MLVPNFPVGNPTTSPVLVLPSGSQLSSWEPHNVRAVLKASSLCLE